MNRTQHAAMMNRAAQQVIDELKSHGIIIQRYDSVTSASIYLKLDYGVLKSIRISDHPSKKHLHYRYNLQSDLSNNRYDRSQQRFFYPLHDIQSMIRQILSDRNDKKSRYGNQYNAYMMQNIQQNGHKKGFWSESEIV